MAVELPEALVMFVGALSATAALGVVLVTSAFVMLNVFFAKVLPIASIFIGAVTVMDPKGALATIELQSTASDATLRLIGALVVMYGHGAFAAFKSQDYFMQSTFHFWAGVLAYNWWGAYGAELPEAHSSALLVFSCSSVALALSHWPLGPQVQQKVIGDKGFCYTGVC